MDFTLILALIVTITIGAIIASVILLNKAKRVGKDTDLGLKYTSAAYITIAVDVSLIIAGFVYLCIESSFWLILLIFILPLIILEGLILTLVFGVIYLVQGYKRGKEDKKKITIGMTCLIINASILFAICILIILFMSGLIPIRFM